MTLEDRQLNTAFGGLCVLLLPPAILCLVLILVTGWLFMLDTAGLHIVPNIHAAIYGWASSTSRDKHGALHYRPSKYLLWWPISIVTLYLLYQACEWTWQIFKVFRRALTT